MYTFGVYHPNAEAQMSKKIEYVERLVMDLNHIVDIKEKLIQPGRNDWTATEATKIIGDELKGLKEGRIEPKPEDIPF
jgi:hypothetical protein